MDLSVVIPSYNRCSILSQTLDALAVQEFRGRFEVLVVDDGSTDETCKTVMRRQQEYPVPLQYLYQPNRKQGAARNLGAHNAKADWILFLGDDIVPTPGLLAEHRKELQRSPSKGEQERRVVIGYTTWPKQYVVSRFLKYIGEQGWQFGFSLIEDPDNVPFNFLYTSNVSINRHFFFRAGGFDEEFKEYGWEDIELSLRLQDAGMRLVYAPKAIAHHHHRVSIGTFIQRQLKVGFSAWYFYRKHPAMADFLSIDRIPEYGKVDHLKFRALTWICRITENWDRPDLSHYYPDLMSYYYLLGLIQGREADSKGSRGAGVRPGGTG